MELNESKFYRPCPHCKSELTMSYYDGELKITECKVTEKVKSIVPGVGDGGRRCQVCRILIADSMSLCRDHNFCGECYETIDTAHWKKSGSTLPFCAECVKK